MFPYKYERSSAAVSHYEDKGPCFGEKEFYSEEPFNGENKCACSVLYREYDIPYDYNNRNPDCRFINMLTNVGY